MSESVEAVVFDLDDTLFPQCAYLAGAFDAVAAEAGRLGLDRERLRAELDAALSDGSDRGNTIDRALAAVGDGEVDEDVVSLLVRAFHDYVPERLEPYPGVEAALSALSDKIPLGLVSDGNVPGQRAKLAATGLGRYFAAVVFSDERGRAWRKPNPAGLSEVVSRLSTVPARAVMVGDRPEKDVAAALSLKMRAVRVRTGEYAAKEDLEGTWSCVASVADAARLIEPLCARERPHLGIGRQP